MPKAKKSEKENQIIAVKDEIISTAYKTCAAYKAKDDSVTISVSYDKPFNVFVWNLQFRCPEPRCKVKIANCRHFDASVRNVQDIIDEINDSAERQIEAARKKAIIRTLEKRRKLVATSG